MTLDKYLLPRKTAFVFFTGLGALSLLHITGLLTLLTASLPHVTLCPFRLLTGLNCPGCGMTRSMVALAGGDLWCAACFNPFSFFLVAVAVLSLVPRGYMEKEPPRTTRFVQCFYVAVLAEVIVYWAVFRLFQILPWPL